MEDPKYIADIVKLFSCTKLPEKHSKTMVFKRFTEVPMTTYEEFIQDEQSIIANNVM